MPNIVAIVGRPNVGKSTLFNRLIQRRDAIVESTAGVRRDRHYGRSDWNGKEFSVIDTGGYMTGSDDVFEAEIRKQVELALEEANLILFLVSVEEGITDTDREIAQLLRRSNKPVLLVANKVDTPNRQAEAAEFYGLGMGDPFPISSSNGSGSGELLDEVVKHLTDEPEPDLAHLPRIVIAGRPNVGKSSMTNALLGREQNIVTDIAGTTRDAIETRYNLYGHDFFLVDTAGLRKKTKVKEDLEFFSVMRSVRAIEHADVVVLMLDATQGVESQDLAIFSLAEKNRKGVVIVVNKWDLVEKETNTMKEYTRIIKERIAPFTDVPIIFTSVTEKQRILKVVEEAVAVAQRRSTKISTSKLNDIMLPIVQNFTPPAVKGKFVKIKFVTQLPTATPQFAYFANLPQYIRDPYRRFVENKMREHFNLTGVPIQIYFRQK